MKKKKETKFDLASSSLIRALNSTEKVFFTSLLNLIFRNTSENACLAIHFLTNQMQINFNSKNKTKFDLASSSLIRALREIIGSSRCRFSVP